ncbi:MAG: hypothetical protein AAFX10_00210 [Pseudomonadota bacterium]
MRGSAKLLAWLLTAAMSLAAATGHAQTEAGEAEKAMARMAAIKFLNFKLPSDVELYYFENADNSDQSLAIRYDWNSANEWTPDPGADGLDFSGTRSNFFARGNYVFQDDVNPSELSRIGADWSRRWFTFDVNQQLTEEQGVAVQECLRDDESGELLVDDCRERLGFDRTNLSYLYIDVNAHANIEGDQQFDQRAYVFGAEANFSKDFGGQGFFVHPILTLGIEQVDPKDNVARDAVMASDDIYTRAYGEFRFTSLLGRLNDQQLKLSFSIRYFKELDPETVIKAAGLDTFRYTAVALQIPAAAIPGFDNQRNSFVLSFADGKLPYNRSSETVFELGFRHNIDFAELF